MVYRQVSSASFQVRHPALLYSPGTLALAHTDSYRHKLMSRCHLGLDDFPEPFDTVPCQNVSPKTALLYPV